MSILEQIEANRESMGRLEVHVPEWDKRDESGAVVEKCMLYFPPFTGHEHKHLGIRAGNTESADIAAKFIVERAQLHDGTRAFSKGDRVKLVRTAEYHVMQRIVDKAWDWTPEAFDPEDSGQAQT